MSAAIAIAGDCQPPIPYHPLADVFPLMEGAEFDELVADIKAHGLREHIVLHDGRILDGRNRYRACLAAGVPHTTTNGDARIGDPAAYVISANIRRRHLTAEQKRELIEKLIRAEPTKSNRQVAETVGVSHTHVNKVRAEMEEAGDVETASTSIDTMGRKQPAKKGWSHERYKQHRAKRDGVKRERQVGQEKQREKERREGNFELSETEAKRFATKLIALDRDLAQELRRLLSVGAELEVMDAIGDGLGQSFAAGNDVDPDAAAEAMKAKFAAIDGAAATTKPVDKPKRGRPPKAEARP